MLLKLLEESGTRQHEVFGLRWTDATVAQTKTTRERTINFCNIPHNTKRGFRQSVLEDSRRLSSESYMDPPSRCEASEHDYLFRNEEKNRLIDRSTFSRHWTTAMKICNLSCTLHTYRAYRITQLIMSGVESELVARNLGLNPHRLARHPSGTHRLRTLKN